MVSTAIMNRLFLAFTAVSGIPSMEENSAQPSMESLWPFTLEKGGIPRFLCCEFCYSSDT